MKARFFWALMVLALCTACSAAGLARQGAADPLPSSAEIVYVTPTARRTLVPTAVRHQPTATIVESGQVESAADPGASCETILEQLYADASDHCLAGPSGYFCSGGLPPIAEPPTDAFKAPGAVVEAARVESLRNPALADPLGMGIVWLRLEDRSADQRPAHWGPANPARGIPRRKRGQLARFHGGKRRHDF